MPLFRVDVKSKAPGTDKETTAPPTKPSPPSDRQSGQGRRSGLPALAAGAVFGLIVIGAVSYYLAAVRPPGSVTAPSADVQASSGESGAPADRAWVDARTGPAPINPEFNLEDPIAYVGGEAIPMRDLDRSVRVAQVLGAMSGDPVPEMGTQEFRDYQVMMLRRLIDLKLMEQGAERAGMLVPGGATTDAVDGFLREVGTDRATLESLMATYGVSDQELDRWFRDARTSNFFVTQSLTVGRETDPRDEVTKEWLDEQWATQPIEVYFYEPGE